MFERKVGPSGAVIQPDPRDPEYIVVASVSGGKDSTAMCLWLKEQGIEHRRVCMDTGWEHESWADYVDYLRGVLGPIDVIQSLGGGMVAETYAHNSFPSRMRRWCTKDLKIKPLLIYIGAHGKDVPMVDGREPINCIGIRAEESKARSQLPQWDFWPQGKCHVWRPLINWTEADVIDIHKRHNIRPNPLYLKGASRVGCWPCIFARKAEIKLIADIDPGRIELIREMESNLSRWATEKAGEPKLRAWFNQERNTGSPTPIDRVVDWSRTSYGGKQYEMFASETEGCVRWGLCEGTGMPGWARKEASE